MLPADKLTRLDASAPSGGVDIAAWSKNVCALAFNPVGVVDTDYQARTYWRGQAQLWPLSPGLHRAIASTSHWVQKQRYPELADDAVAELAKHIVNLARDIDLYPAGISQLPDLQLLSYLQHQGVATPLLDFTTDPFIALAIACADQRHDESDGVLFCYRYQPSNATWVRRFSTADAQSVLARSATQVNLFEPPFLTSRQRIQRGVFFLSSVRDGDANASTVNIDIVSYTGLLYEAWGAREHPVQTGTAAAIVIPAEIKQQLRAWLRVQHQIDEAYVYPEPITRDLHREFIEDYGTRKLIGTGRLPSW